jgi:TPR repeat protein
LSTILDRKEAGDSVIKKDPAEANLWARSVFDRRLSAALAPCISELMTLTDQNDNSFLSIIIKRADQLGKEAGETIIKKKKKTSRNICYLVGILYIDGTGVEQDVPLGITYLTKASESGHEGAGVELAKILGDPFKYPKQYNIVKSLEIYESVAEHQQTQLRRNGSMADARALTDLARVYYEGSETIPRDIEKAYKYARKIAESIGEQYCQFIVGDILLRPPSHTNIKQDIQQSVFWLTQSGEQGFPLAIETLSRIYFEGKVKGMKRDYEQARHWCFLGDDIWPSGLGYCQMCLGDMYRQGLGVPKDLIRSFEYYQKAASQQDAPQNHARFMLGEM